MGEPHVISALRAKRAQTAGDIVRRQYELDQLRADLMHIDAVLRLLDPEIVPALIPPTRQFRGRSEYLARGELSRRVSDGLRVHGEVSAEELAAAAMRDKGLALTDHRLRRAFAYRFTMTCSDLTRRGRLERIGQGKGTRWKLAEAEPALI